MSPLSLCFVKLFSDWLLSIGDNGSHANVRKKSNIANRSKSHCERSHAICERSHANFKQRIACDLRIANEVEMGLYSGAVLMSIRSETQVELWYVT